MCGQAAFPVGYLAPAAAAKSARCAASGVVVKCMQSRVGQLRLLQPQSLTYGWVYKYRRERQEPVDSQKTQGEGCYCEVTVQRGPLHHQGIKAARETCGAASWGAASDAWQHPAGHEAAPKHLHLRQCGPPTKQRDHSHHGPEAHS